MAIKLLIFDLDGTLVDSAVDIAAAINYAIEPYGVGQVSVEETIELIGEGVTKLIEKLIRRKELKTETSVLMSRFLDYYSHHLLDSTCPYPGTRETLEALSPYTKIVISNKVTLFTVTILKAFDLMKYFVDVAGSDVLQEKKPSPVPVINALSRFKVTREEAVVIGDSTYDMQAGRAAGVKTVAVLYGYGSPGFAAKADYRVARIEELMRIVQRMESGADE